MKMKWNLRVLMAERDIPSATALQRRLGEIGVEISTAQIARVVKEMPGRTSTTLLRGLLEVLQCYPNDLIVVEHDGEVGTGRGEANRRKAVREKRIIDSPRPEASRTHAGTGDVSDEDLTGPRVMPFPTSLEDKD